MDDFNAIKGSQDIQRELFEYFIEQGFIMSIKYNYTKLVRPDFKNNLEIHLEIITKEIEQELQFKITFQAIDPKELLISQVFVYKTYDGSEKLIERFYNDLETLLKKVY